MQLTTVTTNVIYTYKHVMSKVLFPLANQQNTLQQLTLLKRFTGTKSF